LRGEGSREEAMGRVGSGEGSRERNDAGREDLTTSPM
jgi:hypothetical protein